MNSESFGKVKGIGGLWIISVKTLFVEQRQLILIAQELGYHLDIDKELKNPFAHFWNVSFHMGTYLFQAL